MNQVPFVDGSNEPLKIIQVASSTPSRGLALSITEEIRRALRPAEGQPKPPHLSLHAMGSQAVSTAMKAVIIAGGLVATMGVVLLVLPSFEDKPVPDHESAVPETVIRTIVRLRVVVWRVGG